MDLNALNVLINDGGTANSRVAAAIGGLIQSGTVTLKQAQPLFEGLFGVRDALESIQTLHDDAAKPAAVALPNGLKVVDVGDKPVYGNGSIDPRWLSVGNWRYVQDKNLLAHWVQIFATNEAIGLGEVIAQAMGSNPGTITNAQPDPIVHGPAGDADLSAF